MSLQAQVIQDALKAAELTPAQLADFAGVAEERIQATIDGRESLDVRSLDRIALVFGVPVGPFLDGEAVRSPATMLFRSHANLGVDLEELAATDGHLLLADLMRCARELSDLRRTMDQSVSTNGFDALPDSAPIAPEPPFGADDLAMQVRQALGLGLDPIASMARLLGERLGVDLFWVTPDELSSRIEGACAWSPTPAIIVNLVGGQGCWWNTRTTLAHELCHLAFDRGIAEGMGRGRFFWFSPKSEDAIRQRYFRSEAPDLIEQRANAFAAYFLAPPQGVERLVGDADPTSETSVAEVMAHFGVGRMVAVNVIRNVFGLSKQVRNDMLARRATATRHALDRNDVHPDQQAVRVGLRTGNLEDLALQAFAKGRIDAIEVRRLLGLTLCEALPRSGQLTEAQRAAPLPPDHGARMFAMHQLMRRYRRSDLDIGPGTRVKDRWVLPVYAVSKSGREPWGSVTVTDDRMIEVTPNADDDRA